ncbi:MULTISPECIES: hypothetical protein [unclassified Roseivivax]|uniref:hypothetical protein n=1 Tax=Roseivivax sp. GX 12232 TaxID=2900547 RepID=UPI001E3F67D6|nr:hypothetical protein [Roseivivax sp. GX 12232]MCE0506940.1 hypothetical protein [Roseivivax sp. GX 12232]
MLRSALRRAGLALLACLPAALAEAGAWPREKGALFVSTTSYLSWSQDLTTWTSYYPSARYDTLFIEYGLTERWTVGLDLGRSVSGATKTVAFATRPFARPVLGLQVAPTLGIGQIDGMQVIRPALSLGKGADWGWLAADFAAELFPERGETDVKLDLTMGAKFGRRRAMVQFQGGQQAGDAPFLRVVPSVTTPLFKRYELELGGSYGVIGDSSMGLKLGLWAEF